MDTHAYDITRIQAMSGANGLEARRDNECMLRGIGYAILTLAEAVKMLAEATAKSKSN